MNPDLPPFCADKCVGNIFLNVILEFLLGKSKSKFQSTHVAAADILDKELVSTSFSPGARNFSLSW